MKEILLPYDVYKHPARDFTWEMDRDEIEDKIKELRKQIYHLQNCRKKQPMLAIFRKERFGEGEMRCHVFHGFQILDEKDNLFCADCWLPIDKREAELLKERYKLTDDALKVIDDTIAKVK